MKPMESNQQNGRTKNRHLLIILVLSWYSFTSVNVRYSKLACDSETWSLEIAVVTILLLQYVAGCIPYMISNFVTHSAKGTNKKIFFTWIRGSAGLNIFFKNA